ncbi:MAG: DUF4838 domain-containing protein [Pirellulales bacterium]|nr:DUF4838 domain-containing protein [Pirellulales bacterium]
MRMAAKNTLCAAVGAVMLVTPSARAETSIVVNFGPHPSAQAAGNCEATVDWSDADRSDDTVCTEAFAALELQTFLRKMTGRNDDFNIADDNITPPGELILIGSPSSNATAGQMAEALGVDAEAIEKLGEQGYRIKTAEADGRRVTIIAGGGRVGTLYGVYDLLHRLGYRWFSPAAFDEETPHAEWKPAFDVTEQPSFEIRGFHSVGKRDTPEFIQWMVRNRLNQWTIEVDDKPLMRKLGIKMVCGGHDSQRLFLNPQSEYPYNHPDFDGDEAKHADPYAKSESYQGDADKDGKLTYFEAHPEWFALLDGHRSSKTEPIHGPNFCTSNADACAEYAKNFAQAIVDGRYRGADIARVWTADWGKWCECPQCKALGTPTDRYMLLVHRFAQELKRVQREGRLNRPILIRFLAYADVVAPPTRPLPEDFDYEMCQATFFPIKRCYVHRFGDPECDFRSHYKEQLEGWMTDPDRHFRGRVCIGEYYNYSRFKGLPVCFMHVMQHDIPFYYRAGARHFHYMHVTTKLWGSKSLTNYQMARQIWDVDADCEALWEDYFAKRYGPVAETMRRYYESLEKMLCNIELLKGWHPGLPSRLAKGQKPLLIDSHMQYRPVEGKQFDGPTMVEMVAACEKCRELIDEARSQELPERIKARLAEDEKIFTYAELTLRYYDQCIQAYHLIWDGKKDEARPHYEEAKRVAELLRKDTESMKYAYAHREPFELNGFTSTLATSALDRLEKLLGEENEPQNKDDQ